MAQTRRICTISLVERKCPAQPVNKSIYETGGHSVTPSLVIPPASRSSSFTACPVRASNVTPTTQQQSRHALAPPPLPAPPPAHPPFIRPPTFPTFPRT